MDSAERVNLSSCQVFYRPDPEAVLIQQPQCKWDADVPHASNGVIGHALGETGVYQSCGSMACHAKSLHIVGTVCKRNFYINVRDVPKRPLHNVDMSGPKYPNHVRAWRLFRYMTQEELAEAAGCSTATIGHIETGERRLSDKWAHPIAKALNTTPGYLLDHDPNDLPTAILDTWAAIPEENRAQALAVLETFKRTGTEG